MRFADCFHAARAFGGQHNVCSIWCCLCSETGTRWPMQRCNFLIEPAILQKTTTTPSVKWQTVHSVGWTALANYSPHRAKPKEHPSCTCNASFHDAAQAITLLQNSTAYREFIKPWLRVSIRITFWRRLWKHVEILQGTGTEYETAFICLFNVYVIISAIGAKKASKTITFPLIIRCLVVSRCFQIKRFTLSTATIQC